MVNDPCILGTATPSQRYPLVWHNGKAVSQHRLVYAEANGLDVHTMGGVVLHACDNTRCINRNHLSLGTHASNVEDKVEKDRQAKGEGHGMAELNIEQVQYIKAHYVKGSRTCGGRALAKRFNVHESTVSDIMLGYTWRHV